MTEQPDLGSLWQSDAPKYDTEEIMLHIELEQRSETQLDWTLGAVNLVAIFAALYVELLGGLKVPGLMIVIVGLAVACQWWSFRKRKQDQPRVGAVAPRAALEFALRKARNNLKLARGLQLWLPAGVISGYAVGPLLREDAALFNTPAWLNQSLPIAIMVVIGVAIVTGTLLARDAKYRIRVLESRLGQFGNA